MRRLPADRGRSRRHRERDSRAADQAYRETQNRDDEQLHAVAREFGVLAP